MPVAAFKLLLVAAPGCLLFLFARVASPPAPDLRPCCRRPAPAGWGYRAESQVAGLGPDANLLRFVKQHVMGKVGLVGAAVVWAAAPRQWYASRLAVPRIFMSASWSWAMFIAVLPHHTAPPSANHLVAFPVGNGASLTLSAEAGLLLPWGARALDAPTSISGGCWAGLAGEGTCGSLPLAALQNTQPGPELYPILTQAAHITPSRIIYHPLSLLHGCQTASSWAAWAPARCAGLRRRAWGPASRGGHRQRRVGGWGTAGLGRLRPHPHAC